MAGRGKGQGEGGRRKGVANTLASILLFCLADRVNLKRSSVDQLLYSPPTFCVLACIQRAAKGGGKLRGVQNIP